MNETDSISRAITRLKEGQPDAAGLLWERFCCRLIGLARTKLGESPRRAADEEDIAQSAFKSFCLRAQDGQFPNLHDRNDLWNLLAKITVRKAANQFHHQRRAKRGGGLVAGESALGANESSAGLAAIVGQEPTPEVAAEFIELFDRFMDSLDDPAHRAITFWKLEGWTNPEIARHLDCSLSAVERKLRVIRERLQKDLRDLEDP